jgi:hypothetical protein
MGFLNLVMAFLALWRWTELVTMDRVFGSIRQRWPSYIFSCQRCVSVWAGVLVTAVYLIWPYGNWPFGLSALYILVGPLVARLQPIETPGRRVAIELDPQGAMQIQVQGIAQTDVAPLLLNAYGAAMKASMPNGRTH